MPKQILKLDQFHGGLNSNSAPRDIAPNELSIATDVMVDELGKIRMMGENTTTGVEPPANAAVINPGYGLFQFSHDRTGAEQKLEHSGTYTHGSDSGTVLIDSAAAFTAGLVGGTARNLTDGSSGTVASVDSGTQLTVDDLLGGTDNVWDASEDDAYVISWPETGDDYLVMADADTAADIDIYSRVADAWGTAKIDLGAITGMKPCFYAVDGALRVSDGNFGATNSNKWYGYIKRDSFVGDNVTTTVASANALGIYDGWYVKNLSFPKPTAGLYGSICAYEDTGAHGTPAEYNIAPASVGTSVFARVAGLFSTTYSADAGAGTLYVCTDSGSNEGTGHARDIRSASGSTLRTITSDAGGGWGSDKIRIYPPVGTGWNIYCQESSTAGSWSAGQYWIGITFIYEGNQESEVYDLKTYGGAGVAGALEMTSGKAIDVGVNAHAPYDEFISGGRAYIRKKNTNDPWILLADISIAKGVRTDLTAEYTDWFHDNSSDAQTSDASLAAPDAKYLWVGGDATSTLNSGDGFLLSEAPSLWTYQSINGYKPEERIDIGGDGEGFKTAVVTNRQVYIGHVRRENEDGQVVVEGDAMYKSIVNKFDTFPLANKIEASVGDGDEIVKLEEYADRILQFKKNKMHLINVSQDIEFLEDTFMHKGVSHPAAVCKTDFGIAWVNKLGCYLYDGQKVNNLLEKGGRQIIKESLWATFTTNEPMVGYLPKKRQLIVVDDNSATGTGNIFLYDMVTQSWTEGSNATFTSNELTNFVTDWNGDLIHAHTDDQGTVLKWADASAATGNNLSFQIKDIDFGQPGQRKKIYKAYVSYKGDGSNVRVDYKTNGDTDAGAPFYRTTSDGSSDGTNSDTTPLLDVGTDDWVPGELKPVSSINNVYSFTLLFDGEAAADFEVNDISIVYRLKNVR